jgi:hypothetical protein
MSDRNYTSAVRIIANDALITIPHNVALEPATTGQISVSYWIRPVDQDNNLLPRHWAKGAQYMCAMGDPTNGKYRKVAMEVWNGTLALEIWADDQKLNPGMWYHIVFTFDQGDGEVGTYSSKAFINGKRQKIHYLGSYATWVAPMNTNSNVGFRIGEGGSSDRPAGSDIMDMIYYNRILSDSEAKDIYYNGKVPSDCLARWKMDEGSGNSIADSSENGFDGTASGTQTWVTDVPFSSRTSVS